MKHKKITLCIDTSDNATIIVGVKICGKDYAEKKQVDAQRAQAVLPTMDKLLSKYGLNKSDLTAIEVHTGPGSFTGLRVGVAVANTLGTVLQIPINGKQVGETVEPVYE